MKAKYNINDKVIFDGKEFSIKSVRKDFSTKKLIYRLSDDSTCNEPQLTACKQVSGTPFDEQLPDLGEADYPIKLQYTPLASESQEVEQLEDQKTAPKTTVKKTRKPRQKRNTKK